jgi:small neutral amino acid transporter SnatA (MarC family)
VQVFDHTRLCFIAAQENWHGRGVMARAMGMILVIISVQMLLNGMGQY